MSELKLDHTIAAIATPVGEGGLSVIRLSGPEVFKVIDSVFRGRKKEKLSELPSHRLYYGEIIDEQAHLVDQVLVSVFRAPHSYTGEDVLEISSHGGMVVTRRILDLLVAQGAHHAEPGEFTKRAFLNGKMDLTQAEAVLDLIKAKSDKSMETAIQQLSGALSRKFQDLKDRLMKLYAHMEAYVDFPDEDVEVYEDGRFRETFKDLEGQLIRLIDSFKRGSILKEGISMVLVGKPNVGKSSLFNALLERDRAIVSDLPGTTRDALEEWVQIKGIPARLIDTAGLNLEGSRDAVEKMGMERTRQAMKEADLFLYILDVSMPLEEADRAVFKKIQEKKPLIVILNKEDLPPVWKSGDLAAWIGKHPLLALSTKTGKGLSELEQKIEEVVIGGDYYLAGEQITRLRHKNALQMALQSLQKAFEAYDAKKSLEFVIVDLQAALQALRELVGEVYSEDLLDVIFSEFCIGK